MATETTVSVRIEPELSEEFRALLGTATEDTLEKLAAGAQLSYALYHCPAEVILGLPDHVHKALARMQAAYSVGRPHPPQTIGGVSMLDVADSTDPIRAVETEESTGA